MLFLEENSEKSLKWNDILPANANEMTLLLALNVIESAAMKYIKMTAGEKLSLFIGVDEYQAIPDLVDTKREDSRLQALLNSFMNSGLQSKNVHIYPAFAGTQWSKLDLNITNSSFAEVQSAPMRFLRPTGMESVIHSHDSYRLYLKSPEFRRNLFFLGGLAWCNNESINRGYCQYVPRKVAR